MPEYPIKATTLRKFGNSALGLSDHQFWRVFKPMLDSGQITTTHPEGSNAHLLTIEDARKVLAGMRANPNAQNADAELPAELAALAGGEETPPEDPKPNEGGAGGVDNLAGREGPKADPSLAPNDPDPEPDPKPAANTNEEEPEPKRKVHIPRKVFLYVALAGAGLVGVVAVRNWLKTRKGAAPAQGRSVQQPGSGGNHDPVGDLLPVLNQDRAL